MELPDGNRSLPIVLGGDLHGAGQIERQPRAALGDGDGSQLHGALAVQADERADYLALAAETGGIFG